MVKYKDLEEVMAKNDKLIVAFLVSMGLFSTGQATQYIDNLNVKEKKELVSVSKLNSDNVSLCESVTFPAQTEAEADPDTDN